jgi:cardiolipin synthase
LTREPGPYSERGSLLEQAFSRASGTRLIPGNHVELLRDATQNYPAWLEAIAAAERWILFESYIIHDDELGHEFARALSVRARAGVRVRVLYDWLGALGKTRRGFWHELRAAGVEVRRFNPPAWSSPFAWLSRDHRKMLAVDGRIGFVTGLCVGRYWAGDPVRGLAPWRDTGIALKGPAVAALEEGFARMWARTGAGVEASDPSQAVDRAPAGPVSVRIVDTDPGTGGLYRLDQLVAAAARRRLWLSDAYFLGTTAYVQALRAAARDGVDVRLLVPGASDIWALRELSRAGYRPLLEGGVRVYEWNGSMMHAKTAVADGQWARVGSSNLNPQSWFGNWELDAVIEDEAFAQAMEQMYLADLSQSTEIVLTDRSAVVGSTPSGRGRARRPGSAGRAAAGAVSIGSAVGAAMTGRRPLGPAEARLMTASSALLVLVAAIGIIWPRAIAVPVVVLALWLALAALLRAQALRRRRPPMSERTTDD